MSSFVNPYGLIVKIDQQGRIVQSFHDPTGLTVPDVSEVEESGNLLSLGSYHSRFIAQVKL